MARKEEKVKTAERAEQKSRVAAANVKEDVVIDSFVAVPLPAKHTRVPTQKAIEILKNKVILEVNPDKDTAYVPLAETELSPDELGSDDRHESEDNGK